ncbi:MAG: rhomboid family intramembrane serine protease [Erysipelotrichaceae bacterium]|nr:rhomboid family intramembrane serine protease [Erysipelotrichaceae bacterium]
MNEKYKLYQLLNFFVTKFSYKQIISEQKNDDIWLYNPGNDAYQLIRLTLGTVEQVVFEKERIDGFRQRVALSQRLNDLRFLDIHIGREEVLEKEIYDTVSMDSDYYSGIDVSYAYPGIKRVIHPVTDGNAEIGAILSDLQRGAQVRSAQKRALKAQKFSLTYVLIALCVIDYLIQLLLSRSISQSAAMVIVGANYKMFTLGLHQFWRLLTVGLTHGSPLHLLMNMTSLFYMGPALEHALGKRKFLLLLGCSLLISSLTSGAFQGNALVVGMSGGLYGLMGYALSGALRTRRLDPGIYRTLFLNLCINFIPGVDVYAHIGGFVTGVVFSFLYSEIQRNRRITAAVVLVALLGLVSYRYFTNVPIRPVYGGTDAEIVQFYADHGLQDYAAGLTERLYEAYLR